MVKQGTALCVDDNNPILHIPHTEIWSPCGRGVWWQTDCQELAGGGYSVVNTNLLEL